MNIYSLRAMPLTGRLYTFSILDAPVVVGKNEFVLLKRQFTPIMKVSTVDIGTDLGIFLGDVVRDPSGELWYIGFDNGFAAYNKHTMEKRLLYEFEDVCVVGQMVEALRKEEPFTRMRVKFKYHGKIFTLHDTVGKLGKNLVSQNIKEPVVLEDIRQCSNVKVDKQQVYFGDEYKGLPVFMCYGRVCVQSECGVYDILAEEYIMKESEEFI